MDNPRTKIQKRTWAIGFENEDDPRYILESEDGYCSVYEAGGCVLNLSRAEAAAMCDALSEALDGGE